MLISEHFVFTKPAFFNVGETMRARYYMGKVVGMDKVKEGTGRVIEHIEGRMIDGPMRDERCRLPISVDGVQLWRGW